MSPRRAPAAVSTRAITSRQISRSPAVYPTMVGLPFVPEEAWMRATSASSTAKRPNGYASRSSLFRTNGSRAKSSRCLTSTPPSRSRWNPTRSTAQRSVWLSRSRCRRRRASRGIASASGFQITSGAAFLGSGSFHRDRLDEPVLPLQEARYSVQRAVVCAGLEANAIGHDVTHVRIAHQHLPKRPESRVGAEEPVAARCGPLALEHEADGPGPSRRARPPPGPPHPYTPLNY